MANNINYGSINASSSSSSFSPTESLTRQQSSELKIIKDSIAVNLQKIQNNTQKLEKVAKFVPINYFKFSFCLF